MTDVNQTVMKEGIAERLLLAVILALCFLLVLLRVVRH